MRDPRVSRRPPRLPGAIRLVLTLVVASSVRAEEPLRVGTITIDSLDIYSKSEAQKGFIYRGANHLHIQTRTRIIRKFLLFKEGDPYLPEVLAETERNLRHLPFLKSATVTAQEPHDGVVDVAVTTQDSWTTELGGNVGSKGGTSTYSIKLNEQNVLGTGRRLSFERKQGVERGSKSISYVDPYLFGPYWDARLFFSQNSDGQEKGVKLSRPFYQTQAPWSFVASALERRFDLHLYENGQTSSIFSSVHREALAEYGKAIVATTTKANRLTVGFLAREDTYGLGDHSSGELPDARQFRYVYLRYELVENDFLKLNYVNRDLRFEDFNLAPQLAVSAGVSPRFLGVPNTTELMSVVGSWGHRTGPGSFVLANGSFETRIGGGLRNAILSTEVNYVRKIDTRLKQTFVAHTVYEQGWNLDPDQQFFADGQNGLRAYRLHAFSGDRRFILNVEHRLFLGREILQLVTPGVAIFCDVGTALPKGQPWRLSDLKSDVGISLRLGVPRSSQFNTLRIDAAYALSPDPFGKKGLLISISSAQSF